MLAFIDIVNEVATQCKQTNQVNPRTPVLKSVAVDAPAPPFTLAYKITESAQYSTEYLAITINPSNEQSGTTDMKVTTDGYIKDAISKRKTASFYL